MSENHGYTGLERRKNRDDKPIRVGVLGCGIVGGGVIQLLQRNAHGLALRAGAPIELSKVLVRDISKRRTVTIPSNLLTTNASEVLDDPTIDVVVEVIGGEATAYEFVVRALQRGKSVVTANKMLLAKRGIELIELAKNKDVDLAFEGAVGGGIPIIRTLREAFASDRVTRFSAIINGTCNYVLTQMQDHGASLEHAIREAQDKGYAEADPSLDIDGHDAAHKLAVLAMLAFGGKVNANGFSVEGIREIDELDHEYASRFGYTIKHVAIGCDRAGALELRVHPTLIPKKSILANVSGVLNAVLLEGEALGPCLVYGRGAGDLPTAVSVVSDVLDVCRSRIAGVAGLQTRGISVAEKKLFPISDITTRYYLRFTVADEPGVVGRLAGALGQAGVSIEQIVQRAASLGEPVNIVMTTHQAREGAVARALQSIEAEKFLCRPPRLYRIEDL